MPQQRGAWTGRAGVGRGHLDADAAALGRHAETGEQDGAHDCDVSCWSATDNIRSQ